MKQVLAGQATGSLAVVVRLGTTQTIAWASSYSLPAVPAVPIARDLGLAPTYVFAALSGALVISALLGPRVGYATTGLADDDCLLHRMLSSLQAC